MPPKRNGGGSAAAPPSTAVHTQRRPRSGSVTSVSYEDVVKTLDFFDMLPESFFAVKEEVTPLAKSKVMVILALTLFIASISLFGYMFNFYRALDTNKQVEVSSLSLPPPHLPVPVPVCAPEWHAQNGMILYEHPYPFFILTARLDSVHTCI